MKCFLNNFAHLYNVGTKTNLTIIVDKKVYVVYSLLLNQIIVIKVINHISNKQSDFSLTDWLLMAVINIEIAIPLEICSFDNYSLSVLYDCLDGFFQYQLKYDSRDDRLLPSSGKLLHLTQELAGLGGNSQFFSNQLSVQLNQQLMNRVVSEIADIFLCFLTKVPTTVSYFKFINTVFICRSSECLLWSHRDKLQYSVMKTFWSSLSAQFFFLESVVSTASRKTFWALKQEFVTKLSFLNSFTECLLIGNTVLLMSRQYQSVTEKSVCWSDRVPLTKPL